MTDTFPDSPTESVSPDVQVSDVTPPFTCTLHVAFFPFLVDAVMVHVPALTIVTFPALTLAILVLLLLHVTARFFAPCGDTVAVSMAEGFDGLSVRLPLFNVTLFTSSPLDPFPAPPFAL